MGYSALICGETRRIWPKPVWGVLHIWLAALVLIIAAPPAMADQEPLIFAVVVGHNDGLGVLPQLHYADDDALRFYRLATRLAPEENVALFTELDIDTWRRVQLSGKRPPAYLPPTKKRLLEVIQLFKKQIAKLRREKPNRPVHLYFFFSGHGEKGYFFLKKDGEDLIDSAFTGEDLKRTFADSQATLNGLFIDACKSQSLFIPKGPHDADEELGPDFSRLISKLEQTTNDAPIGVLTSTVSDQPAGEARDIQGGYFSHVLTSGLSGAADANSDGIVRYGELAAFVSFHTRRIAGQRPWFRPPQGRLDTPLVLLKNRRDLLEILPGISGHFAVFDAHGENLLLEVHKTEAQWIRLILSPGQYKVVWIAAPEKGIVAHADLRQGPLRLMMDNFKEMISLGQTKMLKGEGLGSPPEPEETQGLALRIYDPESSGFDQPFTPRVVSALVDAYNAGISAAVPPPAAALPIPIRERERHLLSIGYGFFSPPFEPFSSGHGLDMSYAYRLHRLVLLGARAGFTFASYQSTQENRSFRMQRLFVQAEGLFTHPLTSRFELGIGGYVGWQLAMITRDTVIRYNEEERQGTALNGDPLGLRSGVLGTIRLALWSGLWISFNAAWGLELIHEENDQQESQAHVFWRPQFFGQVGYAF